MKPKKKTTKVIANRNGLRISYHEKICSERMKTLFKAIDEMRKDIKELKGFMNKGKGAATIMMILGGLIGSLFYFLNE